MRSDWFLGASPWQVLKHGLLRVELPRREETKPRRIAVAAA